MISGIKYGGSLFLASIYTIDLLYKQGIFDSFFY